MHRNILIFISLFFSPFCFSQNFQALHGSPYAGSMATDYNPAALLDAPYRWDATIAGIQVKDITNSFSLPNLGVFNVRNDIDISWTDGYMARYGQASATVNLVKFRYRINQDIAVSFAANLRSYMILNSNPANWSDTLNTISQFLTVNKNTQRFQGRGFGSGWMEYAFGGSYTFSRTEQGHWNAGLNLRIMKSFVGAYAQLDHADVQQVQVGSDRPGFILTGIGAHYGYSASLDGADSAKTAWDGFKMMMSNAPINIGADLGVEYVRYHKDGLYDDGQHEYSPYVDYNWKLGISVLDIGRNKYQYGSKSLNLSGLKQNVTDKILDSKFDVDKVETLSQLNDSIKTIINSNEMKGDFYVNNPTRLLINFDKNFGHHFYVNAEVQVSLSPSRSLNKYNTQEAAIATITPRWETRNWGVFLPIQYETKNKVWVGVAVKAGPVIAGVQKIGWITSRESLPEGGAYLALRIYPFKQKAQKDKWSCPED